MKIERDKDKFTEEKIREPLKTPKFNKLFFDFTFLSIENHQKTAFFPYFLYEKEFLEVSINY
jgi:hypothetical protein